MRATRRSSGRFMRSRPRRGATNRPRARREKGRRGCRSARCGLDDRAPVVRGECRRRNHQALAFPSATATPWRLGLDSHESGFHERRRRTGEQGRAGDRRCPPHCRQVTVVTTGSGGRPYTSGSSRSRKNAPAPPIPSSGSAPYSSHRRRPRRAIPRRGGSLELAARRGRRTGSTGFGHAWAQAGLMPSRRRS